MITVNNNLNRTSKNIDVNKNVGGTKEGQKKEKKIHSSGTTTCLTNIVSHKKCHVHTQRFQICPNHLAQSHL